MLDGIINFRHDLYMKKPIRRGISFKEEDMKMINFIQSKLGGAPVTAALRASVIHYADFLKKGGKA